MIARPWAPRRCHGLALLLANMGPHMLAQKARAWHSELSFPNVDFAVFTFKLFQNFEYQERAA